MATPKINKLLKALGGKVVTVTMKYSPAYKSNPVVMGVLLDADDTHYYLGEDLEVAIAIPVHAVNFIADSEIVTAPLSEAKEETPVKKPFGTKLQ
jgi:hypothetical protein